MTKEVTTREILDAVHAYSTKIDVQFAEMQQRTDARFAEMQDQFAEIKRDMVTKSYLDERIADLRGEIVATSYREIRKHELQFHSA